MKRFALDGLGSHNSSPRILLNGSSLAGDDLDKLKQEFLKLTPKERASIARVMLKGAVEHARRKKKGTLRATRTN